MVPLLGFGFLLLGGCWEVKMLCKATAVGGGERGDEEDRGRAQARRKGVMSVVL